MAYLAELKAPTCWLELHRAHLLHNLAGVRALAGSRRVMAVLKANAYGAGAAGIAAILATHGIDLFGVGSVREGVELRDAGVAGTIVCLTYFTADDVSAIFHHDLTPAVFTPAAARLLSDNAVAARRRLRVWIKVDTGLGRLGVAWQVARDFVRDVLRLPGLEIDGLFSTLAENPDRDRIQVERLTNLRRELPELAGAQLSLASSYGLLSLPESYLDVVRPGIMLLGQEPDDRQELDAELLRRADLRPAVTWKARVGYVKTARAGEQVGYGRRPPLAKNAVIATLAVGWADGYPPSLAQPRDVLIGGRRCPVLSISANSTLVDATDVPDASIGDEVVLLGRQAGEEIRATELAWAAGGSVYRVLSAVPREVPRMWVTAGS